MRFFLPVGVDVVSVSVSVVVVSVVVVVVVDVVAIIVVVVLVLSNFDASINTSASSLSLKSDCVFYLHPICPFCQSVCLSVKNYLSTLISITVVSHQVHRRLSVRQFVRVCACVRVLF